MSNISCQMSKQRYISASTNQYSATCSLKNIPNTHSQAAGITKPGKISGALDSLKLKCKSELSGMDRKHEIACPNVSYTG